jgi:hypothetical protein
MERSKQSAIICIAILSLCATTLGKIIYVDDDANGLEDGSSWQDAYRYLQDALTNANAADKPVEVRVAQGVYRPDRTSAQPGGTRDRNAAFHLIDQLTLKGGFAGAGTADPNARDVTLYKSVLSGDLGGNDVELTSPVAARDEPTRADNCYHVVGINIPPTPMPPTWVPMALAAELDGFVITAGYAFDHKVKLAARPMEPPAPVPGNYGGGMYLRGQGHVMPAQLIIRDCLFIHNYAEDIGGAIHSLFMGNLALIRCALIENGTHGSGGGLYDAAGTIEVSACRFEHNRAGAGGAIVVRPGSSITLSGCSLIGNVALGAAGGIAALESVVKCLDCVLKDNMAGSGAGLFLVCKEDVQLERCHFIGNRAAGQGGAILDDSYHHSLNLRNCLLSGNAAKDSGGAIWNTYNNVHLVNCTAYGNRAPQGRFLVDSTSPTLDSSIDIRNCIVRNGGEDELWSRNPAAMTVEYTNMEGAAAICDSYGSLGWGTGNMDVDPCFVEPGYWDPNGTPDGPDDDYWVDGDYHLKSQAGRWDPNSQSWVMDDVTSACIDAGDPNSPIGEEPEPNGGRINLGAYGGTHEASMSHSDEPDVISDIKPLSFILP